MAVVLNKKSLSVKPNGRAKGRYDILNLKEEEKGEVIYRKLESQNPEISDTQTDISKTWVEQFTDLPKVLKRDGIDPRLLVKDGGDEEVLKEDDGLILTFHGKFARECSLDERGRPITVEQAEEIAELTGESPQKFNLWEFRLAEVIITDGPERRVKLMESVEEQRARSEEGMLKSIERAFGTIAAKMGGDKVSVDEMATNPEDLINYLATELDEETRIQVFAQAEEKSLSSKAKGKK